MLSRYQHVLLDAGVTLFWWTDVSPDDKELFVAAHMLGVRGIMSGFDDMTPPPHKVLTDQERPDIEIAAGPRWRGNLRPGRVVLWFSNLGVAGIAVRIWSDATAIAQTGAVPFAVAAFVLAYVLAYRWIPPAITKPLVFEWRWSIS